MEIWSKGPIMGRYKPEKSLRKSRMVETFLGNDLLVRKKVIIKVFQQNWPSHLIQSFEQDIAKLAEYKNPHLVPIQDSGFVEDFFFLVRPFMPGQSLRERLETAPLSLNHVLELSIRLLDILEEAHSHNYFLNEFRPENLILGEGPEGVFSLVDFGPNTLLLSDPTLRELPLQNICYIPPERSGLINSEIGESSDLYSLGILLYEALVGSPPFLGRNVGEILRQQLMIKPSELSIHRLEIPPIFKEFILRLISRDPHERYQSVEGVRYDLIQLMKIIQGGGKDEAPLIVLGLRDRRKTLKSPAFVGREKELENLLQGMERATQGENVLYILEAESGKGKSRLLEEFSHRITRDNALVLRGQGLDKSAQGPFQFLKDVVDQLIELGNYDKDFVQEFQEQLGDQQEIIGILLPKLKNILRPSQGKSLGSEAHGEIRGLIALAALLSALGTRKRPACLILEDCQWGDEMTLKMLEHWNKNQIRKRGTGHLFIIVSYRSEEFYKNFPHINLVPQVHLKLADFSPRDTQFLIESMAGPLPGEILEMIINLSGGSPFFASSILQGLVQIEAIREVRGQWEVDQQKIPEIQSSKEAGLFLARRLGLLPPDTLNVMTSAALLGKSFDISLLSALTNLSMPQILLALNKARKNHFLWADNQNQTFTFVHDKIREELLTRLSEERKKELYLLAAKRMEEIFPDKIYEISYFFDASGRSDLSLPYALRAGRISREQHALEIALNYYQMARRGEKFAPLIIRQEVAQALGDIYMLRGYYDEARVELHKFRAQVTDPISLAQNEAKLGELEFKCGNLEDSSQAIGRGLKLLGGIFPENLTTVACLLVWEAFLQVVHSFFPSLFLGRKGPPPETRIMIIRLHRRLAYVWWFLRGSVPTLWTHLRSLNMAENYSPSLELGQVYADHAPVIASLPFFSRGVEYSLKGFQIARQMGDLWGEGHALAFCGTVLYSASRYKESVEKLAEAVKVLKQTGDLWEANTAGWHLSFAYFRLGDLQKAVEVAQGVYQVGLDIGDPQATGISLESWAKASQGKLSQQIIDQELGRGGQDAHTSSAVYQASGVRFLAEGNFQAASEEFKKAFHLVKSAGMRNEYVASIPAWLCTSLRLEWESHGPWNFSQRKKVLREARHYLRVAYWMASSFKNNLPHVLRERALWAAIGGNDRKCLALLQRSLDWARKHEARFEEAKTLMELGKIEISLSLGGAREKISEARSLLETLGVDLDQDRERPRKGGLNKGNKSPEKSITLSLVDRFETLLEYGRAIASALSIGDIYDKVNLAALNLLRGEECFILIINGENRENRINSLYEIFSGNTDRARTSLEEELVELAISHRRPMTTEMEVFRQQIKDNPVRKQKSALCAPISVRGKIVSCFYLGHSQVEKLFGREEERLGEFIASLAGAALENSEGFTQIRNLTDSLHLDIAKRKDTEKELQTSLEEKKVLLREIYHRTKNNMQTISSLLNIQARKLQNQEDLKIFRELQNRIRSISLVHEKLYQSKDLEMIDFQQYSRELTQEIFRFYGTSKDKVKLDLEMEKIKLNIDTAIPCGLILNELICNCLKYAFPNGQEGKVTVVLKQVTEENGKEGDGLMLMVKDNGVGLPSNWKLEETKSLGLKLIHGLVRGQLSGKLEIKTQDGSGHEGPGTEYIIYFPKQNYKSRTAVI